MTRATPARSPQADRPAPASAASSKSPSGGDYALPLRFEPNRGQAGPHVSFVARARGYTMFLSPTEAVIKLRHEGVASPQAGASRQIERSAATIETPAARQNDQEPLTLRMTIAGAQPAPRMTGELTQPDTVSYISGNDKGTWLTDIPTYARVRSHDVYPGVDLVYHNDGPDLEHDFVVAAGADPRSDPPGVLRRRPGADYRWRPRPANRSRRNASTETGDLCRRWTACGGRSPAATR